MNPTQLKTLNVIAQRALLLANQMIYTANNKDNQQKGDPKVGGHCSASTSALHILGALHLVVKSGYDHISNKPHASPTDHAYNYLLELFLDKNLDVISPQQAEQAMKGLRAFPNNKEYVFQSYHSIYDPDHHNFLPSGTVGIPPVIAGYLALAYKLVKLQGYTAPPAHFWSVIGDSEFREGSLMEAIPDLAEREIGNLTWILDYNRQSLDGPRLINEQIMQGSDASRIQKTMQANGWEVISVQHGSYRQQLFQKPHGQSFKHFLEQELKDYEFQILFHKSADEVKTLLLKNQKIKSFVQTLTATKLKAALVDLGGHDFPSLIAAMKQSKQDIKRPCFIIAHTIKGWGLDMACMSGNHSYIVSKNELLKLKENINNKTSDFPLFNNNSEEYSFLQKRKQTLYKEIKNQHQIKNNNKTKFKQLFSATFPENLSLNFKNMNYPHTQWFLGQVVSKFSRIAESNTKDLKPNEALLKHPAQLMYSMSPDVGTSTNLSFPMNHKIFGPQWIQKQSLTGPLEDKKSPNLITHQTPQDRFIRFEITEANSMCCMLALGKIKDILGVPLLPIMTIYDFFIKRALDQYFYALYWDSSFILCGTPSGVTLSSEGAQHGWKSDFQIPNQITWEPCFLQEMDWILADALNRHFTDNNKNRTGVLIRAVTKGIDQTQFLNCLKTQKRFKKNQEVVLSPKNYHLNAATPEHQEICIPDKNILSIVQKQVLSGAYYLLDYKGYADYTEADNIVHVFSMGATTTSAINASKQLLDYGIYANVIVITSPDLLLSNLAYSNNYMYLKAGLNIQYTKAPIISVHDGEPGLLDNIGSILGVLHESLAIRKHSRCGPPTDVYKYHKIDTNSIVQACLRILQNHSQKPF